MPSRFLRARGVPALLALTLALPALAAPCPTRDTWPTAGWPSRTTEYTTSHAPQIKALEDYLFTLQGPDAERRGVRTDGLVIIKSGQLIYERYARGFTADKRHLAWSVTKSITSALTGIAVGKDVLKEDDSVCRYITPSRQEACSISVRHLLGFGSGLDWKETYEEEGAQASSVLATLYGEGHEDRVAFITAHKLRDAPGSTYSYSTGDLLLLAGVVDEALRQSTGREDYAWPLLFDVLGLRSAVLERDGKGRPSGGSHFYATPRDMAKFGFLYLNDGCWDGQRVLPEGWVQSTVQVSPAFRGHPLETDGVPGYAFWLNTPVPEHGVSAAWPDAPPDTFAALGHWGQSIFIIPSEDMVIVRTADDRDGSFERNRFLPLAIAVGR